MQSQERPHRLLLWAPNARVGHLRHRHSSPWRRLGHRVSRYTRSSVLRLTTLDTKRNTSVPQSIEHTNNTTECSDVTLRYIFARHGTGAFHSILPLVVSSAPILTAEHRSCVHFMHIKAIPMHPSRNQMVLACSTKRWCIVCVPAHVSHCTFVTGGGQGQASHGGSPQRRTESCDPGCGCQGGS